MSRPIDADALIKRIDSLKHRIAGPAAGFVDTDSYECGAVDALTDARNYVAEAPTMTDGPRNQVEERILKLYQKRHDEACGNKTVRDPVAWALYQVWREIDAEREEKRNERY